MYPQKKGTQRVLLASSRFVYLRLLDPSRVQTKYTDLPGCLGSTWPWELWAGLQIASPLSSTTSACPCLASAWTGNPGPSSAWLSGRPWAAGRAPAASWPAMCACVCARGRGVCVSVCACVCSSRRNRGCGGCGEHGESAAGREGWLALGLGSRGTCFHIPLWKGRSDSGPVRPAALISYRRLYTSSH